MTEPNTHEVADERVSRFDPASTPDRYIYEVLAAHLKWLIRSGRYQPNTPLPAEIAQAEEFGVSLGTLRHARRLLEEEGLLTVVPSKGTYVVDVRERRGEGG